MLARFRLNGNNTLAKYIKLPDGFIYTTREEAEAAVYDMIRDKKLLIIQKTSFNKKAKVDLEMLKILSKIFIGMHYPLQRHEYTYPIEESLTIADGIVQRTPEWYEARRKYITASEFAKVLGLDEYCSATEYATSKWGNGVKDFSPFAYTQMNRGVCYEDIIGTIASNELGFSDITETGLIPSPLFSELAASPDGYLTSIKGFSGIELIFPDATIEIKAPKNNITGIPKPSYWNQMQLQMHCAQKAQSVFIEGLVWFFGDRNSFINNKCKHDNESIDISMLDDSDSDVEITADDVLDAPVEYRYSDKFLGIMLDGEIVPKGIAVIANIDRRDFVYKHIPGNLTTDEQLSMADTVAKEFVDQGLTSVDIQYWYLKGIASSIIFRDDKYLETASKEVIEFYHTHFSEE